MVNHSNKEIVLSSFYLIQTTTQGDRQNTLVYPHFTSKKNGSSEGLHSFLRSNN